jgi:signal transduction histidine kinase
LVLGVFGVMQFVLTRAPAYIWYALFSFANCLNAVRALEMSADTDFLSALLPVFKAYFMVAPAAITFFYLKFAWYFLDFQTKNNFVSRWLGRLVTFFGAVLLITTVVGLVNFRWPELSETFIVWFRAMNLSVLVLGIPIFILVTRVKGALGWFIAIGSLLLLSGGVISTAIEWGFEQKPLHEIDFPFDPKAPMCIFALLESLCFALGLGYKTKVLEIEKREAVLEQEGHRLRIARDLHDEMGSTLSSISILSEAALRNMQQDIDRARFSTIGERTRQVMEAMSDIVWSVNPANDTMENVLQRMKEFASEILEAQDIRLHFDTDDDVKRLTLPMEQRKDFYLLFKEAVNNAAKYSGASDVWVNVQSENGGLLLEVRDNGRGFDPAQVKRGNGLWNMERRAERMGAKFGLESRAGAGTALRLQV